MGTNGTVVSVTRILFTVLSDDDRLVDATDRTCTAVPVGSPEVAERDGGSSNGKTWELRLQLFVS